MEVLIPDFRGQTESLDLVFEAGPEVISHNLETVRRLTPLIRSVARYDVSLSVSEVYCLERNNSEVRNHAGAG
jgi:lipoic acid synthetase